ncbi:8-oxo-dGTP pyrophosphatase MutT (NUDIX family) [Catenuloplanes nepalensis]|uniref:8-oxo-dGTP pyrophosphatase MutT (NUDIX family) n=1 Tax=Catenuloplanes nepalensis TaxID=587533 RepID=A0ABT9MMN7_9ACTN|nr:NUDIX hydrolase [Catenuloplanes nepalensis]MDP9792704.1 8-oxo-dGTP pyrophosphatase MutT (NUDIX family) [Catenuloplanes nepalensis]
MTEDFTATLPRKRMSTGLLFRDERGRVLLVEPSYKPYWEVPGGTVEAGESPHAAAAREIEEELGLTVTPGRLLVTDWTPPRPGRTEGMHLVFDGGPLTPAQVAAIRVPADELRGWAWCTPAEATARLPALLARRIAAASRARAEGTSVYLENGFPVA